ncbi:hypothetical protein ABZP36_018030 [Zizania latifolia]
MQCSSSSSSSSRKGGEGKQARKQQESDAIMVKHDASSPSSSSSSYLSPFLRFIPFNSSYYPSLVLFLLSYWASLLLLLAVVFLTWLNATILGPDPGGRARSGVLRRKGAIFAAVLGALGRSWGLP